MNTKFNYYAVFSLEMAEKYQAEPENFDIFEMEPVLKRVRDGETQAENILYQEDSGRLRNMGGLGDQVGVVEDSTYREEAFALLSAVYSDASLSNLEEDAANR